MRKIAIGLALGLMTCGLWGCKGKQQVGAPVVPPPTQTPASLAQGEKNLVTPPPASAKGATSTSNEVPVRPNDPPAKPTNE